MAFPEIYKNVSEKGIIHFSQDHKTSFEKYSQNPEKEYWERLMDPNFPVTLVNWELTSIQETEDKYYKKIIGKVKNNSKGNLSEVRIEFAVYDEKEAQIAIISQNTYDLKPDGIWNFALLVTHDVIKARLKGLYHVLQRN